MGLVEPSPPEGTDFYYATLFYPPNIREKLYILEALRREIFLIPITCTDDSVRNAKLQWWMEEIDLIATGKPRHPLSHSLITSNVELFAFKTAFAIFIQEIVMSRAKTNSETFKDTQNRAARIHGPIANLMLAVTSQKEAHGQNNNGELIALIELSYEFSDCLLQGKSSTLVIPDSKLTKYVFDQVYVRSPLKSDNLEPILCDWAIQLSEGLKNLLGEMTLSDKRNKKLFTTLAKIRLAVLRRTIKEGCPIVEKKLELTPLRKLWIAWYTSKCGW